MKTQFCTVQDEGRIRIVTLNRPERMNALTPPVQAQMHKYFDEASSKDTPTWYTVDIGYVETFPSIVSLETLKSTRGLEDMMVTKKGSRLSITPVTPAQWQAIVTLLA